MAIIAAAARKQYHSATSDVIADVSCTVEKDVSRGGGDSTRYTLTYAVQPSAQRRPVRRAHKTQSEAEWDLKLVLFFNSGQK